MSQISNISNLSLDKKALVLDLLQSKQDPSYFINNHCWLSHPVRGRIKFDTYEFQDSTLKDFRTHRFNAVLKSRQMGISTLIAAYSLYLTQFNENKKILIIANKQEVARNIVETYKFMYRELESHLKVPTTELNKLTVRHTNGSFIKATSSTGDAGRSEALSLLVLDEAAYIDHVEDIWASSQSTISTGGDAIILSCVVKGTYVYTDNGPKLIDSFIRDDKKGGYEIDEYNIYGKDKLRTGNLFYNSGECKTKKIYTKYQDLEGSLNHKLYAYSSQDKRFGWYKLDQLNIGDYISIQKGMEKWGMNDSLEHYLDNLNESNKIKTNNRFNKITPELAYFIGLYISEGYCYKVKNNNEELIGGSITITCGDSIKKTLDLLGFKYHLDKDKLRYTISSKSLVLLFEDLGFDLEAKAPDKVIPERLLEMSRTNIIQLLRGIYDGDGSSYKNQIMIRVRSKKLIEQIRILLINFGILSSTYKMTKEQMNSYKSRIADFTGDSYGLEIYGRNVKVFYDKIGFNFDRKQVNRLNIDNCNLSRACSKDIIPNSLKMYKEMYEMIGESPSFLRNKYNIHTHPFYKKTRWKSENISRQNVLKLYNLYKERLTPEFVNKWESIVSEDLVWCKITKIKDGVGDTYDFSLPDNINDEFCHSVLYNGIVGHQTPSGVGNFFHKICLEAEEGTNNFNLIKLPWYLHPERDQEWRDEQTKLLGVKKSNTECDCDFTTSGDSLIPLLKLEEIKDKYALKPIEKQGQKEELWIWKEPEENHIYMVVADVARGDGEDYSGCIVFDIDNMEQVCEYKGKITPKEYGNMLINIATKYNDAVLVVENTGVGWATIQVIVDREYRNLFYSYRGSEDAYVDVNVQIAKKDYSRIDKTKMVPGFSMSSKVRPHIIEKMEQFIRDDEVIIRSERLINELKTFVWLKGKAQAMRGYHDDLVMPLCTGIWIRETALRMKNVGRKYTKKMLEAIDSNIDNSNIIKQLDPYKIETTSLDDRDNDVRWLFSTKDKQADNIHKQHRPPPSKPVNRRPGIYVGR